MEKDSFGGGQKVHPKHIRSLSKYIDSCSSTRQLMSSLISDWPSGLTDEQRLFFVRTNISGMQLMPVNNHENDHIQSRALDFVF